MRRASSLLFAATVAAVALAGCAEEPVIVRAAFEPPPKRLAVVDFDSDLIRGMLPPRPSPEVNAPYQYFRARVVGTLLFSLVDDKTVVALPSYLALPAHTKNVEVTAGGLRAVDLDSASASRLAKELGADLLVSLHFSPEVEEASASLGPKLAGAVHVAVATEVIGWDSNGDRAWHDQFSVDSSQIQTVLGFHSTEVARDRAAEAIAQASQVALERLRSRLGEPK